MRADQTTPETQTYTWEKVPRELLERARKKLAAEQKHGQPAQTLKWKLIELVEAWVNPPPKRGRPARKGRV